MKERKQNAKSPLSEFAGYVSLNILGMVGMSCYILADTYFVSKGMGADGLAALNIAIPIYNFIFGCSLMLGIGGAAKYTIVKAQGNAEAGDCVFTNTLYAGLVISVLFMLAGFFLPDQLTRLLGADDAIFDMTRTYICVMLKFTPAYLLNEVLICFVRNDGNPRLGMLAVLVGSLANIVLDYIFIFPLRMGIYGAVLATCFAPLIGIAISSTHMIPYRRLFRRGGQTVPPKACGFHLRRVRPQMRLIGKIAAIGVPTMITEVCAGFVMVLFNKTLQSLAGNTGVAAYGVIANVGIVVLSIFNGIGQGAQPLISRAYGENRMRRAYVYLRYGLCAAAGIGCVVYAAMLLFAPQVTAVFNSEHSRLLQQMAEEGIRIYFFYTPFAGINIVMSMYFAATEKVLPAQAITVLRGLVLVVPLLLLLAQLLDLTGVWLVYPVTEVCTAIVGAILFILNKKKQT